MSAPTSADQGSPPCDTSTPAVEEAATAPADTAPAHEAEGIEADA